MAAAFAAAPRLILQTRRYPRNDRCRRRPVAATATATASTSDGEDGRDDDDARLLRHVKALLSADDVACAQILSSPEGKALVAMNLHTAARRMVRLRDALPVRDLDVMAMVVEQPSLLAFEGDYDEVGGPPPSPSPRVI